MEKPTPPPEFGLPRLLSKSGYGLASLRPTDSSTALLITGFLKFTFGIFLLALVYV